MLGKDKQVKIRLSIHIFVNVLLMSRQYETAIVNKHGSGLLVNKHGSGLLFTKHENEFIH